MRARGVAALVALAAALAAPAAAQEHGGGHGGAATGMGPGVSIAFAAFAPTTLGVLVGEPVTWTNDSVRAHTVTADDGSFDSGRVFSSTTFTRAFAVEGDVAYHCSLHAGMAGTIAVRTLLLDALGQAAAPGRSFPVHGRAALPAGTAVRIEADTGAGFAPAATAVVGPDGSFGASVQPTATAQLRAVAGEAASPAVPLTVLDRTIALGARPLRGGRTALRATVAPAATRGTVVLQLYLPEHFGWWPVRTLRLGAGSAATTVLRLHRRVAARAVLTLADGATPLAVSAVRRIGPAHAGHR